MIEEGESWWLRRLANTFVGELEIDDPDRLRLGLRRPGEPDLGQISSPVLEEFHDRRMPPRHGGRNMTRWTRLPLIMGSLRLQDGSWLNFVTAAAPPLGFGRRHILRLLSPRRSSCFLSPGGLFAGPYVR